MNWELTEGAVDALQTGGSILRPVLQILGCEKIPNEDRHRLLVSDGHHMSSSVILSEKFNDKLISGELSNYCVVRVDRCIMEAAEEGHLLTILELTILAKGQEVNRKIGKLESFTVGKCDPPAVHRNWQLTEGAIATLMAGGSVSCPVLQILGCKKILNEDRYRLLVSDGHQMSSSVILSEKFNDKLISGELSNYCVVQVDQCVVEEEEERNLLLILELTILAKGQEVKRKIGKMVSFTEGKCDPPTVNRNWKLTEGAMATIMAGGSVLWPVLQILFIKRLGCGPRERYRLLVSDGCHLNSFVMLSTQLNDKVTSGELSDFSVFRVDSSDVPKTRMEGRRDRRVLIILKLTILARGQEVGRKIGQPVSLPEAESDPPAVAPPAVAPLPAAVNQHPAGNPDWQLTQGAMATIMAGGSVSCPVFQILGSKQIMGNRPCERYRLLVSDGCHLNSFVMLATQLNDKVTSGELSDFTVVRVDRWVVSYVQNAAQGYDRQIMIIIGLTILARGEEVGRKIGQPVPLPEAESDAPAEAPPAVAPVPAVGPVPAALNQHPAGNPDWQLTQGAMATIMTGGSVSSPTFQLLGSKRISGGPSERYRLLVSDGRHLNSFAMLATQLNDKVTSGELSDFSVVRVDRLITSQVQAQGRRKLHIFM